MPKPNNISHNRSQIHHSHICIRIRHTESASEMNIYAEVVQRTLNTCICKFIVVRASLTGFMNITMLFALRFVGVFHNFTHTHTNKQANAEDG